MRLTSHEVDAIKDCARVHFGEASVVRLFGSRVRDDLRGGDIDLHIIAETADLATREQEWRFKEALEERIGEQKIDLVLKGPSEAFKPIDHIATLTGLVL